MSKQRSGIPFALTVAAVMTLAWSSAAPVAAAPNHTPAANATQAVPRRALNTATPANAVLRREVFGFVNAVNLGDPNVGYPSWDLSHLSTVAFFALHVNSGNGYIVPTDTGWNVYHSTTMSTFVSIAHANGVKVIVSINLHDFSTDPNNQVCTGLLAANALNTITESIQLMNYAGIDGFNLNYEATNTNCDTANAGPTEPVTSRDRLTAFVKNFRAAVPTGTYIAIDSYSGSAEDNLEFFNVTGLAPYVDSFFVMAYDMDYANSTEAPIFCSQFCMNPVSPLNTYRFNVTKSMAQYTALVPAGKVILGQPYYGRRACVPNPTPALQYPTRDIVTTTYLFASTIPSQTGVYNFSAHRDGGDGVSEWDTWWDTDWNCWREQYFDDVVSLGAKYDVVNADNLRGVGLFTLDYGGGAPELWHLLDIKFATPTPWIRLGGVITSGPDVSSSGPSRTDIFVRGSEGGLWDATWNGTSWAWSFLGGVINADPGAVSWGPNRIDVFVRGIDNALWHRSSDGITWAPWEKLGGVITSGPDAVSTGSGHLDVFVRGTEGGIWRVSWNGTNWSWTFVGGIITSDPGAVASAGNRIDVFVRGTEGGLWDAIWNGATWSWTFLGGVLAGGPDAASCAAGHVDVFLLGTDMGLWQRHFDGTVWGPWQSLRGRWTSDPGAVCPTGTTSASVFERGPDNALWQTGVPTT